MTNAIDCTVTKIVHHFDEVMRIVPPSSVIHLGSGTFETRGYAPAYLSDAADFTKVFVGYVLRPGQRMLGAGLGATTLKLVLPIDEINQTVAIGNAGHPMAPPAEVTDYAEIADLTINCNAPGHVAPHGSYPAPVTCGGILLGGSFMRASRVRVINYCVQGAAECFGLFFGPNLSQAPVFNVIENCIAEKPGENNTHETSVLGCAGDVYGGCVLRANSDSDSNSIRTLNPIQIGQGSGANRTVIPISFRTDFRGSRNGVRNGLDYSQEELERRWISRQGRTFFRTKKAPNGTTTQIHASDQRNPSTQKRT